MHNISAAIQSKHYFTLDNAKLVESKTVKIVCINMSISQKLYIQKELLQMDVH